MNNETLARLLWILSGAKLNDKKISNHGYNIGCVVDDVNKLVDTDIKLDDVIDGLTTISDNNDTYYTNDDQNKFGYCNIANVDCYWIHTNGYSEWTCDKPDYYNK